MNRNIQADVSGFSGFFESSKRSHEQANEEATEKQIIVQFPQDARRRGGEISNEEIFGRFQERVEYHLSPLEYQRNGDEPGLVLILNQEHFESENDTRLGSKKDVEDIISCFGRLGFNIRRKDHIFEDLSRDSILNKFDEVLNSDLSQINSVLVFILSHGENCNIIQCKQGTFKLEDILTKFDKCVDLKGKPKMFVIQACKGKNTTNFSRDDESKLIVPWSTFEKIYSDMLIIYSTLEGKYSYRDKSRGTWLIQEICKNFTAYGWRDDVLSLSSRVIKCVCTKFYCSKPGGHDVQKQVPVIVSTLSKKFYLNRNKDRNYILRSSEMMIQILGLLQSFSDMMVNILQPSP